MANATLSRDEILDAIGNMKVSELVELTEAFKTKFNVTIAVAAAGPAAGGAAAAPAVEEQTEFTVVLVDGGDKKINVIKEVRGVRSDLGLKEAKDLVEGAPQNVVENVSKQTADEIAKKLTEAGAKVQIK